MDEWWRRFGELYARGGEMERLDAEAEVEAEAAWKLLDLAPGATVVDAPCGFGRHAVRLAAWGYEVWGVDVDESLVAQARTRAEQSGVSPTLDVGDIRALPVPDGWADAVLNLASSIGMFDDDADNRRVLEEARRVLRPGGRLLVESTHRDREVRAGDTSDWTLRPDRAAVMRRRSFDPVLGRLDLETVVLDPSGETRQSQWPRVYALTELREALLAAGFATVELYGGWGGEPVTVDSMAIAIAQ